MTTSENGGTIVKRRTSAKAHRGTKRRLSRPASRLAERWTTIDDVEVFYRESPNPPDAPVMVHLHGFGLSGRYLMPTAEALADEFHTFVPDLPGFGRSGNAIEPLTIAELAHAAAAFLDTQGIEKATLVGNSMGCPVICEFGYLYPTSAGASHSGVTGWRYTQSTIPASRTAAEPRRAPRTGSDIARRRTRLSAIRCSQHVPNVPSAYAVSGAGSAAWLWTCPRWQWPGLAIR